MDGFPTEKVSIDAVAVDGGVGVRRKPLDVDLDVEVAGVREDRAFLQVREVPLRDDARITGGGDEDVAEGCRLVHRHDVEPVHVRLERPPGVHFSHDDAGAEAPCLLRKPPAAVAVAGDDEPLARDEDVRGDHDRGERALPGAVDVVEEVLHRGVVDGHDRELERSIPFHGAEPVDAGRGLLAPADDPIEHLLPLGVDAEDQVHAVVDGDRRPGVEHPVDGPVVLLDAGPTAGVGVNPLAGVERRRDVVLGREGVAPRDIYLRTARRQGLDQHRRLCLDVEGHADSHAGKRLLLDEPLPNGREYRHILPRPCYFKISRLHETTRPVIRPDISPDCL